MPYRSVCLYQSEIVRSGIGFGTALAISWSVNKSILWAFYMVFFVVARDLLRVHAVRIGSLIALH